MRAADRQRKSLGRQKETDIRRSKLPARHLCMVSHVALVLDPIQAEGGYEP